MTRSPTRPRTVEAARHDARHALLDPDSALDWLSRPETSLTSPLGADVWVFDGTLTRILLVKHRWRGWVPPGGAVDPGETPREAARRELYEETGVRAELHERPAAVAVRAYHPQWAATLGVSFMAVADRQTPLTPEQGQPAAWLPLDEPWQGWFPEDRLRMEQCAAWLRGPG